MIEHVRTSRPTRFLAIAPAVFLSCVLALAPASPCLAAQPLQEIALRTVGKDQGVFAQAEDGTVLAAVNDERPVHPASVTKVATTLALLDRLGPGHRFVTTFSADGPVIGQTLDGDLYVESQGDPFFVYESAFLALAELRALGLRRVAGSVRVEGPFLFNWQPDRGVRLLAALSGRDGASAWPAVQLRRAELARVSLQDVGFEFSRRRSPPSAQRRTLLSYRSPPLVAIMKALNSYSNNVFHDLSSSIGGPKEVERIARERVTAGERSQILIDNAAGAGLTNRISPRAAAELVRALQREAAEHSLGLTDLLPVAGVDSGTLRERFDDEAMRGMVVGKTGTYADVGACALAGAVGTRRWGVVVFAVLNKGLDVKAARARQDAFVDALIQEAGGIRNNYTTPAPSPLFEALISTAD